MIQNRVMGHTSVYGLIGYPIEHSLSPWIHNTLAQRLNHDLVYVPFPVAEEKLSLALQGAHSLGVQGLNVTLPYKTAVTPFLTGLDASAEEAGAVNTLQYTLKGYRGYNTDIQGVKGALTRQKVSTSGKTVLLLGAGGAARGVAMAIAALGCHTLYIANRTPERAVLLAHQVKAYYNMDVISLSFSALDQIPKADLVIQATSLGFGRQEGVSPVEARQLEGWSAKVGFDLVYSPWETAFLKEAKTAGCHCFNGLDMLVEQAIAAYEIWRGESVPPDLSEELLAACTAQLCGART